MTLGTVATRSSPLVPNLGSHGAGRREIISWHGPTPGRDDTGTVMDLNATLAHFADSVPGVQHVLAVGADGLLSAASPRLTRDRADAMAAITSGLVSLTARSARLFDAGNVSLTMLETRTGYLFMMPSPSAAALVVWADHSCDVGQVGYELAVLADNLRR